MFIQSERDIIEYMKLSNLHNFAYELEFLLTQSQFFLTYDFSNQSVIKYLLRFDSFELVSCLLKSERFQSAVFESCLFRRLIKPFKKTYKILQKYNRAHMKCS